MSQIKVVYKKPFKLPTVITVNNYFKDLQKLVHGPITYTVFDPMKNVDIISNDEALLMHEPPNIVYSYNNEYPIYLCGPIIFAGCTEDGETISLTDEQIVSILNLF